MASSYIRHQANEVGESEGESGKPLLQILDDVIRLIHPLHLTLRIGDTQTRRLHLAAALQQGFAMLGVVLRVAQGDGQRQAGHLVAHFDAERAGLEVVERQLFAFPVDLLLRLCAAHDAFGHCQFGPQQHEGHEDEAEGAEEYFYHWVRILSQYKYGPFDSLRANGMFNYYKYSPFDCL